MNWFTDRHLFLLAVVVYGACSIHAMFLWRRGFRRDDHVSSILLLVGFAFNFAALGARGMTFNACPVNNLYEATTFLLWALAGTCLVVGLLPRLKFLSAFASPVLFAMGVFALMPSLDVHGPKPEFSGALRSIHAATILLAYGGFGLGAVAAAMLLTQQHNLKFHKLRAVLSLLPSIQRLERVTTWMVFAGFILLTIGLAAGRFLPRPEGAEYFTDSKVLWSAAIWFVFLALQVAHQFLGRSSRRFAIGVLAAFVFLLLTFWLTNYLSPLHQDAPPTPASSSPASATPHTSPVISLA